MTEHRLPQFILGKFYSKNSETSNISRTVNVAIPAFPPDVSMIVQREARQSADTALRLSRYFGLSERFWMNLQARYDLEREKDWLAGRLEREVCAYAVGNPSCGAARVSVPPVIPHGGALHSD